MSKDQCDLCHRDLSPGVLVRCRESDCPLTASQTRASRVVLTGLLGVAIVIALFVTALTWLRGGKPPDREAETPFAANVDQPRAAGSAAGQSDAVIGGITGATTQASAQPAGAAEPAAAAEAPDPRAARMVQSFSCEGYLSASQVAICTHWSLATADYNLSLQYKAALRRSRNPQALRKAHGAWLARLEALGGDAAKLRKALDDWRDEMARL